MTSAYGLTRLRQHKFCNRYLMEIIEPQHDPEGKVRKFMEEWGYDLPYVVAHTSGSTGSPKEVRLPKADMRVSALATNLRFGITSASTIYLPLSPDYIAGKMMLVRAALANCRIIVERPSNRPMHDDCGSDIDLLAVVPSQCADLVSNPVALRRVRNIIVGGAPLAPEMERLMKQGPWNAFATYGMTETCSHVALRELGTSDYEAMPGISFSTDSRSCLEIHSGAYSWRKLVTNDVVSLSSPTTFQWRGRFDNVVNSGGLKLHPEELESLLAPHIHTPFYLDGVPDREWGTALRLTVEAPASEAELEELCRRVLPRHAVPKSLRILPVIPRTSSGKLRRF